MKSLLRLVLFAGMLTSLDGINGMIPKADSAQSAQISDANEDWTQEEKDWEVDQIFADIKNQEAKRPNFAFARWMLSDMPFQAPKRVNNKFFVFLIVKGYFDKDCADHGLPLVAPSKYEISKEEFRNLFTTFKNLKKDYDLIIQNSDLTKSESPFIQWLLPNQKAVQLLRTRFAEDHQVLWDSSSWWNFCALHSQYSLGWQTPEED